MSDDFGGFAAPPFKAAEALALLKRALRDLKLSERGNGFELKGKRVVDLTLTESAIVVRIARRLALTPEWDTQTLKSGTDQRKCIDDIGKRLARWQHED